MNLDEFTIKSFAFFVKEACLIEQKMAVAYAQGNMIELLNLYRQREFLLHRAQTERKKIGIELPNQ